MCWGVYYRLRAPCWQFGRGLILLTLAELGYRCARSPLAEFTGLSESVFQQPTGLCVWHPRRLFWLIRFFPPLPMFKYRLNNIFLERQLLPPELVLDQSVFEEIFISYVFISVCSALGSQKRASGCSWNWELQMVKSCPVDTGNRTRVLCENSQCCSWWTPSPSFKMPVHLRGLVSLNLEL